MRKSLGGFLYDLFGKSLYLVAGLDYLYWRFSPKDTLSMAVALPVIFTLGFATVVLLGAAVRLHREREGRLPSVAKSRVKDGRAFLYLGPTPMFAMNACVSVYQVESGIENLLGLGAVTNIQEDGIIEVAMVESLNAEITERLRGQNAETLTALRVKPVVPMAALPTILSLGVSNNVSKRSEP